MEEQEKQGEKKGLLVFSIFFAAFLIAGSLIYSAGLRYSKDENTAQSPALNLEEKIISEGDIVLPIKWGNLGAELARAGVIDAQKLETIYKERGGLSEEEKKLLYGENNSDTRLTRENASLLLNLLWALGLGNKNEILGKGPMMDSRYGGAGRFASTGGWTLAKGDSMNHYSKHSFIILTKEQRELVERVSKNIYRPCCDNSSYFPDCNHGMAMLGLLEIAASQGVNEDEMYKLALLVNSYWFPENYATINKYLGNQGLSLGKADAKEILGKDFSSASGYQRILARVAPVPNREGGGCSV